MKEKTKDAYRIVLGGFAATIAILIAIADIIMLKSLLSPWLTPALCLLPVAIALAFPLRVAARWLTDSDKSWLNTSLTILFIYPLLMMALIMADKHLGDPQTRDIPAVVNRVYKETRYKTRRVSRRVYARGAPYKVNRIDVTLANGDMRSFDVTKKVYNDANKGDTVDIPATTGLFRLVWLDQSHIKVRHPHPRKKKKNGEFRFRPRRSSDEVVRRHRERIDSLRRKYGHRND